MSGLNRYDGYQVKTFRHKIGDSTSINDDYISQVVQGPGNKLWVLTRYGWNVYDPLTEKFISNPQRFLQSIGIRAETITTIVEDRMNCFWFIAPTVGLYKYNPAENSTALFTTASKPFALFSNNVSSIAVDHAGFISIVYSEGVLDRTDKSGKTLLSRNHQLQAHAPGQSLNYNLFVDKKNDFWIYAIGAAKGVYLYQTAIGSLTAINTTTSGLRLNNNVINGITEDNKQNIWIATDHGGVNVIDRKNNKVFYLLNTETDKRSISQNSVISIYKDDLGIIWAGTYKKGLNHFHEKSLRFPLYQHKPSVKNSLKYNDVNKFVEDAKGNLWIGTNGGGLLYFDRSAGTYKQYLHDPSNSNSLSNNVIVSLCIDHEQKLWIGTYFGGLDCFDGKRFINYKHNDSDPHSIADDRVWEIFEDSKHNLWIGTLTQGLDLFDRKEKKFLHHKPGTGNSLRSGFISSIIEDRSGNIWIGTAIGVDRLDRRTGLFTHFEHIENDSKSLSHNNVIEIFEDSRGLIWIATRDGLNLFHPLQKNFSVFRREGGLADNSIATILEDANHNLWLGTAGGLSHAMVSISGENNVALRFRNYDETDGLQARQFNENAALRTRQGEMIFGGANGFNIFQPSQIKSTTISPRLVFTGFQVFNNDVQVGKAYDGKIILSQSISSSRHVTLNYDQNVFTVEFAALNFLNADKIKYAYKLEGFNGDWLTTDSKNRKATFTNLDPGNYTLKIRGTNEDGVWNENPLTLQIHILPPFWQTPYAYVLYAAAVIALLLLARNNILRRAKLKFALEQERREAHRLHELDLLKIKFFTNVSHEFRTPLSLIITPIERLVHQAPHANERKQFQLIYRNARRLLNLVNQLLDFRKMEEHELRLQKHPGDIIHFVKEVTQSFSDLAETKNISLSLHASRQGIFSEFDHEKLERILFNLLSNAFKFTHSGGAVEVFLDVLHQQEETTLQIKVIDTGIGISKEKQEKIFERFFQNDIPGSIVNQGSGIGLAITREFVKLHNGSITVESEPDKGTCFTVLIPIQPVSSEPISITKSEIIRAEENLPDPALPNTELRKGKKKTILLVEDNEDFRFYMKDNLKVYYNIIEAENGSIGWNMSLSAHPDIVVCDISMPEMNGIDLCKKIKGDKRTSFIPVILLTALTGEEQQIAGLQTGASDYITKPFNFEILLSKIRNLLSEKENFKKTYQKQVQVQVSDIPTASADEKFMQQALAVIEKNISNPEFSVEALSREMFMSRVALYKRLFSLTGKTPIEFIRSARLQRAMQLLEKTEMTISEVAYEVGFNNPKNFSKYFKEEFDVLPSTWQNERKNPKS
jgi:signal transduction histidine kinase/ligand-binding sensor domain-containing protein/DNA-binding response OmpR family regulator